MKNIFSNWFRPSDNAASKNGKSFVNQNGDITIDKDLFIELNHPDMEQNDNNPEIKEEVKITPPAIGLHKSTGFDTACFENMGPNDKYYIFMADPRHMFFNKGLAHGYRQKGDEDALNAYLELIITEFRSIITILTGELKEQLLDWEVSIAQSEKMQKRSELVIRDLKERIGNLLNQRSEAEDKKGDIEHAIKSFGHGFDRGTELAWEDMYRGKYDLKKYSEEIGGIL